MLRSSIVRLVGLCARHAWAVIALVLVLSGCCAVYATEHFAIATDITSLFPRDLPWTRRAFQYMKAFPEPGILLVVDAPTPELTEVAAVRLAAALAQDHQHFRSVEEIRGGRFFATNGLLYLPLPQLQQMAGRMDQAAPLIGPLAADPSLRGVLDALGNAAIGAVRGAYPIAALTQPMNMASDTIRDVLAGRPASFSWQALASGHPPGPNELRRLIAVRPVQQFHALEPGRAATDAITLAANNLHLAQGFQARVRQTGIVPIDDGQFASLRTDAGRNLAVTIGCVLVILWLALRSWRLILATALGVSCGLAIAAALGLFLVGTLNLISVAFFVLFIGLGVDFGIQFSVRYRAERHEFGELHPALVSAARKAGGSLALAAGATALGFFSFLPTSYRGLSELGEIAGLGMIVAFFVSITLLPALFAALKPPAEPRPMGFAALAPVDRFLQRYRIPVVAGTLAAVLLASPLLLRLPFDFNPLHLQDPKDPAVATFLKLSKLPEAGANAIDIIASNQAVADATARRVAALPQTAQAVTLSNFIPADQPMKLALIRHMADRLGRALSPRTNNPPPSDRENVAALLLAASRLLWMASTSPGTGGQAAPRLVNLLTALADATPQVRQRAAAAFVDPLRVSLGGLQLGLEAQPVTAADLPPALKSSWVAPDGRARVEVLPKGDPNDTLVLRKFVAAVLGMAPDASGPGVQLYEAGNTIVRAFIKAGIFALTTIFLLLLITLRRLTDVLMTLVPLLLATVVTLELCVALGLPLNFANIIALPLLLGVGVAFKIYYVMAWRRGRTQLVQSTLSRAIIFSAMTTGTAFGSLWLSNQPGMSSMGQLMGLALLCTMAAAVLFQPALMGPPRQPATRAPTPDEAIREIAQMSAATPSSRSERRELEEHPASHEDKA
jgi:uncharacterized protein